MESDRLQQIKALLLNEKKVISKDLCTRFNVSIETVRRDLDRLEKQGVIRKVYGGAELLEGQLTTGEVEAWNVRHTENLEEKRQIAKQVVSLIEDNSTVFLDSGTTVHEIAMLLKGRTNLTIITNAIRQAAILGMCEGITVYCIGGITKIDTLATSGFMAQECLSFFSHIDLIILSGDGFIPQEGIVEYGMEVYAFKRSLIDRSGKVVVAVDHTKFGRTASCTTCPIEKIDTLVTTTAAPAENIAFLREKGINVLLANY